MLKVVKFGGSSMADARQFAKVKAIVESDPARRVVVVSASGKRFKEDRRTFFSKHPLAEIIFYADKYSIKNRHKK